MKKIGECISCGNLLIRQECDECNKRIKGLVEEVERLQKQVKFERFKSKWLATKLEDFDYAAARDQDCEGTSEREYLDRASEYAMKRISPPTCEHEGFTWVWDFDEEIWLISIEESGGPPSPFEPSPSPPKHRPDDVEEDLHPLDPNGHYCPECGEHGCMCICSMLRGNESQTVPLKKDGKVIGKCEINSDGTGHAVITDNESQNDIREILKGVPGFGMSINNDE